MDYLSVIADVEAKITAWQMVLASLKSALAAQGAEGLDLSSGSPASSGELGQPLDLPEGAFYGKSVPACVELYLSAVKKKKTNKEIAAALREGGVESNASNFENVVTGALFGLKKAGKVLRFKDGWGLSEWYPQHIRAVSPAASVKRAKKKGKKDGRKGALPAINSVPVKGKTNERIIQLLQTKPEREYSLAEIAEHIGMGVRGTRLAAGKLLKAGRIKITAPGTYAIGRSLLIAASQ